MTEKLLLKSKKKLMALLGVSEYEGIWSLVLMILKELMLSNADIKIIFADFIEPNTNVFT